MSDDPQEADRAIGAPHPRDAASVVGQSVAEQIFLDAFNAGRLHHAWLLTGPKGVGKATLAWRIARFLLTQDPAADSLFGAVMAPTSLDAPADHPTLQRMTALSEPRLCLVRRPWDSDKDRLRAEITVDEVRKLRGFFTLSATDGGHRVVLIDAADELNVNAANALLKVLEEPPSDTTMLLVSHQPSRLLPTIRSRCRTLRCRQLDADDIALVLAQSGVETVEDVPALAALADGSPGAAMRLMALDGLEVYQRIVAMFHGGFDRSAALRLAESVTGRGNAERFDLVLELFDLFLSRLARAGVLSPQSAASAQESAVFTQLCSGPAASQRWAALQQHTSQRARHGQSVNLDPAALILDITFKINETAAQVAA